MPLFFMFFKIKCLKCSPLKIPVTLYIGFILLGRASAFMSIYVEFSYQVNALAIILLRNHGKSSLFI